jgi:cystathionine beta-lyase/cystathionine gamma-synthase
MADKYKSIETRLIHAGEIRPRIQGAVVMPIFQSANFEDPLGDDYHSVRYIRLNNTPNHQVLHAKLAALEGAETALVTSSGMAAISTSLLTLLRTGDHILMQDGVYGGTHELARTDLPGFGIEVDFIDAGDPGSWKAKLRPNTKAIYVESMTNPLLAVGDIKAVPTFAKEHDLISLIDNTFPSPVLFRPAEHGFDLSLHSGTKYLNGHSDIVAGAVIGRRDLITKIRHRLNHLGGSLDPHACFLLHRGLKTLAVRLRYQSDSAMALATMLNDHPAVSRTNYPGLPGHPDHDRARSLFGDRFSGMLSFDLKGGPGAVDALLASLTLAVVAPSLGAVESLVTLPARTSHVGLPPAERARIGIGDGLVRVSVGLEGTEDLIDDFRNALEAAAAA